MPTLAQFGTLFSELDTLPTPLPRKRTQKLPPNDEALACNTTSDKLLLGRVRRYLLSFFNTTSTAVPNLVPTRPNPFVALKQGNKIIIIAVVDGGSISFFRFGEGCFENWPMA
jgi:tRNA-splicing endonuclease subunit Sen54